MKKLIALLLAAILTFSLTACGGASPSKPGTDPSGAGKDPVNAPDTPAPAAETAIEESVLYEGDGIKITAKSLKADALFGPEVKLLFENNSGKDLTFQCGNVSVNGYMVDTIMSVDVADGKKANDSLTLLTSELEDGVITDIANVCLSFHIFETESWDDFKDTDEIEIRTNKYDGYDFTFDESGTVAYEGKGIKIIVKGVTDGASIFGPGVIVFIRNDNDRAVTVQTRKMSVNGFMIDPIFSADIAPGKVILDDITIMSTDIEENGIEKIEEAELSFHVFYSDNWKELVDTPSQTFTFN